MHSYQVQARGVFGNFDVEGATGTFSIEPPLFLRPIVLIPTSILAIGVLGLVGTLLWRKRAYNFSIRASEKRFRTVTETTSSAMFIYRDGQVQFVNPAAVSLTQYREDELLQMEFLDLVNRDDRPLLLEWQRSRGGDMNVPKRFLIRFATKEGNVRWVDYTVGSIVHDGQPAIVGTAVDITERVRLEENLRALAYQLSTTEERERRRMATYLHDVIGASLVLCKIKLRSLEHETPRDLLQQQLQEARRLLDQSIKNTRTLTFDLSPPVLYELRFESALRSLAEQMLEEHGIALTFADDNKPKPLPNEVRVVVFYAVREVLMNVIKHAEAKEVKLSIARKETWVAIDLEDDGKGFDVSHLELRTTHDGGFGLFNVRERLTYLGGCLGVQSTPGHGTEVSIAVKLEGV
jgi:PAS domain S-box-containing protein